MRSFSEYMELAAFFAPSLAMAAATSAAGSVTGLFVILRRESLLALALPQVVALGAAIGLRGQIPTIIPAVGMVAVMLAVLAWARHRERADALLPTVYIAGLSLSILLIKHHGAHLAELQNLFTGMDVGVTVPEAAFGVPVMLAAAALVAALWRRWLLIAQAPATAQIGGRQPWRWHAMFLAILSTYVLVGTDAVGIVMVIASLFLPAAVVLPWVKRLPSAMAAGALVACLALAGGFVIAVEFDFPMSHSMAALGCGAVGMSHLIRAIIRR